MSPRIVIGWLGKGLRSDAGGLCEVDLYSFWSGALSERLGGLRCSLRFLINDLCFRLTAIEREVLTFMFDETRQTTM